MGFQTRFGPRGREGFSLIELMIVLVVIAVIVSIAVPNLLESKKATNEASAIAAMRTICTAQMVYANTLGSGKFAASLNVLETAKLLDPVLSSGKKDGYVYTLASVNNGLDFNAVAVPETVGKTGYRGFYTDATAVIRYSADGSPPNSSNPPIPAIK